MVAYNQRQVLARSRNNQRALRRMDSKQNRRATPDGVGFERKRECNECSPTLTLPRWERGQNPAGFAHPLRQAQDRLRYTALRAALRTNGIEVLR